MGHTRSQRHKAEMARSQAGGQVTSPPPPPSAPTISITSLDPNIAAHNTNVTVAIMGTNLQPGDMMIWNGGSVATTYIWAGQITADPVATGSVAKTVQVHLVRGAEISNDLPFTVT